MRTLVWFLGAVCCMAAEPWSLSKLFTRPFVWGTPPASVTWSKEGHTLAFLWNAEGGRFLDLYSYQPDSKKLTRVTNLEGVKDALNRSDADKDSRLRPYVMPGAGIGSFDLSRDGTKIAFSYLGDLWIAKTDGSEAALRLTHTKVGERSPEFRRDGNAVAYLRGGTLLEQDLRTGQLVQLVDADNVSWFAYSPDGHSVAYGTSFKGDRQMPLPNYSGRTVTARSFSRSLAGDGPDDEKYFTRVLGDDDAKPVELDCGKKMWPQGVPEWSPDSQSLLLRSTAADFKHGEIAVIGAATGHRKVVASFADTKWVDQIEAVWSPRSESIAYTNDQDGFHHLYVVPAQGGAAKQITRGAWEIRSESSIYGQGLKWIGDYIYYSSTEDSTARRQFYRLKQDGSGKESLSSGGGVHIGIVSEDGTRRAEMRADLEHPLELYVDGEEVTKRVKPAFAAYAWPKTEFVHFPSRVDKASVAAKVLLPQGYSLRDKTKQWPAVFFIHGAGIATSVVEQWGSYQEFRYVFNAYLVSKGYVVFDLDYRGSTGYGREWRAGTYLNMGGPDLDDVLGEVDYANALGNIDMKRIGIWGVSYGGFMTDMALFRAPGVFRAGAAFSAVNDWENYNAGYTEERLNRPEDNPEAYRRSSPIWFSDNLKDSLLIVHGFVDDNVLFQDAVQLSEKLIHEGRRFDEIFYPEESHGFLRDETLIDCFQRTADFFDRNLQ